MKAKIRFYPGASTDLQEKRKYLIEDTPGAAVRIIQNIILNNDYFRGICINLSQKVMIVAWGEDYYV